MTRKLTLWTALAVCLTVLPLASAQNAGSNKYLDIQSSAGGLHAGNDADPRQAGLPVYPGAHLRHDDNHESHSANFDVFTAFFGMKLVVLNYDSDDSPEKIISFYRDKLKKYGKVIECHTSDNDPRMQSHADDNAKSSKELTCDGDNTGNNIELKAGTEDNQHAVAIQPNKSGNGATFALVYVHVRGKQADI
jgi:hypothetical protein